MTRYFMRTASEGIDPAHPPLDWLRSYVEWVAMVESHDMARGLVGALESYFTAFRLENPLASCDEAILCVPSSHTNIDEATAAFGPHGQRRNPRIYAKDYRLYTQSWEQYAFTRRFDPHAPRPEDIAGFVSLRAEHNRYCTIVTIRGYLRSYFYTLGNSAIDSPIVDMTMTGIRHAEVRYAQPVYSAVELRSAFANLQASRLDVRDRLIALLASLSGFHITDFAKLRKLDVAFREDGTGMDIIVNGQPRFVGAASDQDLDPVHWMRIWLAMSPSPTGPLFPRMIRGAESDLPVTFTGYRAAIKRLLKSAREHSAPSIRKAFIVASTRRNGAIATAHYLRYKSITSLARHVPEVNALNEYLRQISKGARRPGIRFK
ncbi:MAG: hypothetical protein KGN02_01340 [bacterium]|nr:hypothetical protein [bacterium]